MGSDSSPVRVGVLGCGTVGGSLISLIQNDADAIFDRTGIRLEVTRVAVRNLSAERSVELPDGVLTRDAHALVADPEVDVVVETIGGIEPARQLLIDSLKADKPDALGAVLYFNVAVAVPVPMVDTPASSTPAAVRWKVPLA